MGYEVEHEIKRRAKAAGLTGRDLAAALGEPPGTTANRLNGYSPLSSDQRRTIMETIRRAEVVKARSLQDEG